MKISNAFNPLVSVPWRGGASNYWRATFNQGIVEYGSSGSPLYDQNKRIVGQLYGNQNNICFASNNNCFCVTQIPAIGEYGRFDISWTGRGTPSTRLKDWLDPLNTSAVTTNTTNVINLIGSYAITGTSTFCGNTSNGYYSLSQVPPAGSTITWQTTGGLTLTSGQGTLNASVVGSAGIGTIQAIITNCGASYSTTPFSVSVTYPPYMGINYTYNNGISKPLFLYAPSNGGTDINNICIGYTSGGYLIAGVTSGTVTFTAISGVTVSHRNNRSVYLNISPGMVGIVRAVATNSCGTETQTMAFRTANCGTPSYPGDPNPNPCNNPPDWNKIKLYNISPNPASDQIKITVATGTSEKPLPIECPTNPYPKINAMLNSKDGITFSQVNIYNSFGTLVLSQKMDKAKEFVIPLNELRAGLYLVQISEGEHTERHQIIIE